MIAYEWIAVGDDFEFGAHRFTADEIKRFAAAYDPQPFHIDETAAERTHFGALCASGWHTAAIMMRLFVKYFAAERERARERGAPAAEFGPSPGFDELKWLKPVYAGDQIVFSGRIVGKRESRSRPGWGIVSFTTIGINQKGEPVFSYTGHIFTPLVTAG